MQREGIIRLEPEFAERSKGNPDRAAVPVGTVCFGDEAELVDAANEGA